jgi:hypothetical protein
MTIRFHEHDEMGDVRNTRSGAEVMYVKLLIQLATNHASAVAFVDHPQKSRDRKVLWSRLKALAADLGHDLNSDFDYLAQKVEAEAKAASIATGVKEGWRPGDNVNKAFFVSMMLRDEERAWLSDETIAETCGVTPQFVSAVRKEFATTLGPPAATNMGMVVREIIKRQVGQRGQTREGPDGHASHS